MSWNWGSLLSSTRFSQVISRIHFDGFCCTCFRSSDAPPETYDIPIRMMLSAWNHFKILQRRMGKRQKTNWIRHSSFSCVITSTRRFWDLENTSHLTQSVNSLVRFNSHTQTQTRTHKYRQIDRRQTGKQADRQTDRYSNWWSIKHEKIK